MPIALAQNHFIVILSEIRFCRSLKGVNVFFVTGSDAPLYHYPITTGALIVVNVLIHVCTLGMAPEDLVYWYLSYGDGIRPIEWITCNFFHLGWVHLIGNMLFLWPFGLLVEGKLGWWRMLLLCLAVCVLHSSVQQLLMLRSNFGADAVELSRHFEGNPEWEAMPKEEQEATIEELRQQLLAGGMGHAAGASCLIFGLLAICAVWAPVNEFDVITRWGAYEWPVLTVAGVFVAKEFFGAILVGGAISTPMLHLFGAAAGFVIGLGLLIVGLVDCEGFDLISRVTGEKFQPWAITDLVPGRKEAEQKKLAEQQAAKEQAEREAARPKWQVARPQATTSHPAITDWLGVTEREAVPKPKPPSAGATPKFTQNAITPISADPISGPAFAENWPAQDSLGMQSNAESKTSDDSWMMAMDLPQPLTPEELIAASVNAGDFGGALKQLSSMIRADRTFKPPADVLHRLAEGLLVTKETNAALKVMAFAISRHPQHADRWRMRSAQTLLSAKKDATAAIAMLMAVDRTKLDGAGLARWESALRSAEALRTSAS